MNAAVSSTSTGGVVVVFARLGPYHVARLRGAADVLGRHGIPFTAIGIAGSDKVYDWDRVETPSLVPTRILFDRKDYESIPARSMARALKDCLDEIDPLAVALPGWAFTEARAGLAWCESRNRHAIVMSETTREDYTRMWPKEVLKRWLVRRFKAALVGGVRHRDYVRQLGIPRAAIYLGYDAVDNDYFREGADRIRANADLERAKRGLPARYILTSCRFIPIKNIDGLLRGYAAYRASVAAPRDLVVCGDGEEGPRLRALAVSLGLAGHVHWPGFVQYPDLPAYYALADAFILASTREPWGLVVNEALACGLPALVSDRCGCAPDLVHPGVNGFQFDPFKVDEIAAAMRNLPEDAAALRAMGLASQRIVSQYGIHAFGEGLLEASRMVLARAGRFDFGPPGGPA